ncbi:hypothetical protein [Kineococcus indalonis]|uniref:hypothetical protein n=1 Tax=Kineococcus indalonis TaxID=2696566 RepID=UPI0014125E29|nr:hypothetical protein [Kineococcus indalonis]NAZ84570.1 hypothetical protein [Kineococcus indalonis]
MTTDIHDCLLRLAEQETADTRVLASRIATDLAPGSGVSTPLLAWAVRVERTRRLLLREASTTHGVTTCGITTCGITGRGAAEAPPQGDTLAAPAGIALELPAWLHLEQARRVVLGSRVDLVGAQAPAIPRKPAGL